jgi:hypothetical protein
MEELRKTTKKDVTQNNELKSELITTFIQAQGITAVSTCMMVNL